MKLQELNNQELKEINGGGLLSGLLGGSNNGSATENGLLANLSIGSLLSFSSMSQDGDESSSTSLSLGEGIGLDLGSMLRSITG